VAVPDRALERDQQASIEEVAEVAVGTGLEDALPAILLVPFEDRDPVAEEETVPVARQDRTGRGPGAGISRQVSPS